MQRRGDNEGTVADMGPPLRSAPQTADAASDPLRPEIQIETT